MSLHPDKIKFMLITTRQKRQNVSLKGPPFSMGSQIVSEVDNHKVLGVTTDCSLSWSSHVTALCKSEVDIHVLGVTTDCGLSWSSHVTALYKSTSKKIYHLSKIKRFLNLLPENYSFTLILNHNTLITHLFTPTSYTSYGVQPHFQCIHGPLFVIQVGTYGGASLVLNNPAQMLADYSSVVSQCSVQCSECVFNNVEFSYTPGDIYLGGVYFVAVTVVVTVGVVKVYCNSRCGCSCLLAVVVVVVVIIVVVVGGLIGGIHHHYHHHHSCDVGAVML